MILANVLSATRSATPCAAWGDVVPKVDTFVLFCYNAAIQIAARVVATTAAHTIAHQLRRCWKRRRALSGAHPFSAPFVFYMEVKNEEILFIAGPGHTGPLEPSVSRHRRVAVGGHSSACQPGWCRAYHHAGSQTRRRHWRGRDTFF